MAFCHTGGPALPTPTPTPCEDSALTPSGKCFSLFFKCHVKALFKCHAFSQTFCGRLYFPQDDMAIFPFLVSSRTSPLTGKRWNQFSIPWKNWACLQSHLDKQKQNWHCTILRLGCRGFLLAPLSFLGTQVLGIKLLVCDEAQAMRRGLATTSKRFSMSCQVLG